MTRRWWSDWGGIVAGVAVGVAAFVGAGLVMANAPSAVPGFLASGVVGLGMLFAWRCFAFLLLRRAKRHLDAELARLDETLESHPGCARGDTL